jgi:hypothetical protein
MKIMRRVLMLSTLALVLSGGAAFADRWHGGGYHGGGYRGGVVVRGGYSRPVVYGGYRRPIYVGGPVIREHYYSYYHRPALIVENYGPREGYVWVRGGWTWNGYEWIWAPGHYQPVY